MYRIEVTKQAVINRYEKVLCAVNIVDVPGTSSNIIKFINDKHNNILLREKYLHLLNFYFKLYEDKEILEVFMKPTAAKTITLIFLSLSVCYFKN